MNRCIEVCVARVKQRGENFWVVEVRKHMRWEFYMSFSNEEDAEACKHDLDKKKELNRANSDRKFGIVENG
jgi:hypothetical protein